MAPNVLSWHWAAELARPARPGDDWRGHARPGHARPGHARPGHAMTSNAGFAAEARKQRLIPYRDRFLADVCQQQRNIEQKAVFQPRQIEPGNFADAAQPVVERIAVDVQRFRRRRQVAVVAEPGF